MNAPIVKAREGMGMRASVKVLEKSHTSIMRWEQKLAAKSQQWSPPTPAESDITVEGNEVYTRVGENLPPSESKGWTVTFIKRKVWRHGLEVAIKIKGSQGNRRVEWVKSEHPYTAIRDKSDVQTNHNEANTALCAFLKPR